MAYIKQRGEYWRAEIRRKGHKPTYRTFDTQKQAQQWARRIESEMDSGLYIDRTEAERTTLREALERYKREIVPTKRHPMQEVGRVDRWLRNDLCHRTLAKLKGADFARYRDARREQGRAENTIRLELQLINHIFETARKEWGMEGLPNPLDNIRKPSGSRARDRRLVEGEYEQIYSRLSSSGNRYVVHAFDLAIETSLRKSTLFGLKWEWINLESQMIKFPFDVKSPGNKGVPQILPISKKAVSVLLALHPKDVNGTLSENVKGLVLDTTPNAAMCIWKLAMKSLDIPDLRWHDLRHEAASRLFEKGMHPMEVASITGHKSMQMLKRYTHLKPESLLVKLG
ncbi:tyrosine-type recombinase/integrase [Undibacterium terreum]|uniref:Integrase n=1 Tax=Undibacterium terreum TaxID=1224302 RepID=A0A916XMM2_9BURK|nr:site-specific integrase [Undibacterium terreum]GGC84663.1 integrase [Undibacterium terreum]